MQKTPFYARNAFLILLGAVFLVPIAMRGSGLTLQNTKNDVKEWLPDGFEETKELEWFRDYFLGEQFVVVSWDGCTLDDPRLEKLAACLVPPEGEPDIYEGRKYFKKVITGPRVLKRMTDPDGSLGLSMREAKKRLRGSLIGHDGQTTCLVTTLTDEAQKDLRKVLGNARPLSRILMQRDDGILVKIADRECNIAEADLIMGGPPVDNVAIDDEGEITMLRLVGLSGLVGLLVSYYCFRSKSLTAMVFCCGVYSAVASLAIVYFTGGTADAVLMSMPSLVYVLGLSGAIHIVNYYKDAVSETGVLSAAGKAVKHGWLPCTLAALTTALGLGSLYTSEVIPIQKFGKYAAFGVLFTIIILFTLLPAFLQLWPPPRNKTKTTARRDATEHSKWMDRFMAGADWILRRHGLVTVSCAILMIVLALGVLKTKTSVQLLKLFDGNADIIQDYTWLEQHLGNLVPMEVVLRVDPDRMRDQDDPLLSDDGHYRLTFLERLELVRKVQQNLELLPEVGRALSVVTFAPDLPAEANDFRSFAERSGYNAGLQDHRDEFLKEDYFRVTDEGEELLRISARLAALSDVDYGQFVEEIRDAVQPILAAYYARDEILTRLDGDLRGRRVCVIGVPRPLQADEDSATTRSGNAEDDNTSRRSAQEVKAATLVDLLRVAGIRVTPVYTAPEGYTPKNVVGADEENTKAAAYFGRFDLVYVAQNHPSVEHGFIENHAQDLVDARQLDPQDSDIDAQCAAGIWPVYTGIVPLVYKAQRTLLTGLIESTGLAFVLICLVMMTILRSPTAGFLSMIPNVFPVIVIFGSMGWLGITVDIGTMMTASVAMGVAVDDTVHFLTWFRRGILNGLDRRAAVRLAYERCATAMIQTTIIGGLGLAVFAFSTFTPTQRFGVLMLLLLNAALVGDLVFLPALLAGPVGRFFSGRLEAKARKDQQTPPSKLPPGPPHYQSLPAPVDISSSFTSEQPPSPYG